MHAAPMPEPFATALEAAGHRDGIHGHAHWRRVAENGLFVAQREGADPHAVLLFAILHDCRRQNDGHDPGHGPRAGQRLRVAQVRPELAVVVRLGREGRIDRRQARGIGHQPGLGPIGEVAIGEQEDRGPVFHRDPGGLDRREEAVRR